MTMHRVLGLFGLLMGAAGLLLQFTITIPAFMDEGNSLAAALIKYFSYYTILSNICLVLVYLSALTSTPTLAWFRRDTVRAMLAAVIVLVMGFYHLVLADTWQPQGLFKVADVVLHYITPLTYIIWWLVAGRRERMAWSTVPFMLVPSAIYLAYIMVRGALTSIYPYPVLDAHTLGYGAVAINVTGLIAVLLILFAAAVGVDTFLARRTQNDA